MSARIKLSKEKFKDKKSADKIYQQLLRYTIYGSMVIVLAITVFLATQSRTHDTRSRASNTNVSAFSLKAEEKNTTSDCYTHGDYHSRIWSGNLVPLGTFTVELPFCDQTSVSNIGFAVSMPDKPDVSYSVVSPNGKVFYPGGNQMKQSVCLPSSSQSPIESGTWKVILTNWSKKNVISEFSVIVAPQNSKWLQSICE